MAGSAILSIKILTDAKDASKGLDQTSGKLDKFQSGLRKAAVPAAIAAGAVVAFGKAAYESASRTQQAMGAVDSVFGKSAGTVKRWAANAATQVGLAKSEYGELAAALGASLKNAGLPMDQVTAKTGDLIKIGADLAATYGGTTKEAVEALGSALRGEADPAERYGLALSQTRVQAELAAKGQDKLKGSQLAAAKAAAIVEMATKQAGGAVGQFARESDSAAGSAQIAAAQYENTKAALGEALLPVVAKVTAALGKLAGWMSQHTTLAQVLAGVVLALAGAIFTLLGALKVYNAVQTITIGLTKRDAEGKLVSKTATLAVAAAQKVAAAAQWAWNAAISANPIGLIIIAVIALVAGMVLLYKKSATFRNFVLAMWAAVQSAARSAANVVKGVWQVAFAAIRVYIGVWKAYFQTAFGVIKALVKTITAVFKGDWKGALAGVKALVQTFKQGFMAIFNLLPSGVRDVLSKIAGKVGEWVTKVTGKVSGLGEILAAPFTAAKDAVDTLVGWIKTLVDWIGKIKIPDLGGLGGLIGKVMPGSATIVSTPTDTGAYTLTRGAVAPVAGPTRGGGGPTIIVQGALDPEAVARQIQRILTGHTRRQGLRTA